MVKFDKKAVMMVAFDRPITVTNNVRNELNGLRAPKEVVYTETLDGSKGKPYYPRQFPAGTWVIQDIVPHGPKEPYLFPFFIRTGAHQPVEYRELVNGAMGTVAGTIEDYGYGLHHSSSSTTLGCIKIVKQEDLLWLVEKIKDEWKNNRIVKLEVV